MKTNSLGCSSPVVLVDVFTEFVYKLFKAQVYLQKHLTFNYCDYYSDYNYYCTLYNIRCSKIVPAIHTGDIKLNSME